MKLSSLSVHSMNFVLLLTVLMVFTLYGKTAGAKISSYKLGTFGIAGKKVIGLVLEDKIVIEIEAANADYQ